MSSIAVSAPRTNSWPGTRLAAAILIVLAVGLLAFSVGRITASDNGSTPLPHFATPTASHWGTGMCAHGIPC